MPAKLYGIGVGPGDKGYLTLKAIEKFKAVDIIYVPTGKKGQASLAFSIAEPYIPSHTPVKTYHFPMTKDQEVKTKQWDQVAHAMAQDLDQGKSLAFLTLGDPSTYSTFTYLEERLGQDYPVEVVAGITSYQAMATALQLPLVIDEESFTVLPATTSTDLIRLSLKSADTIVIMKIKRHLKKILALLDEENLRDQAYIISQATMEEEKVYGDLSDWQGDESISYFSTMIVRKSKEA